MSLSKIIKIKRIVEISQSIISKINTITDKKDIHLNRKFMNKTKLRFKGIKFMKKEFLLFI
jgi:hypothetical protein